MTERVLFCPGNRMIAYDWSKGRFGGVKQFIAGEDGYREFQAYMQESGFHPVHIMVDLIEEEFHADTVPFVWGSDRAAVLDRAIKKYFRTSELRSIQLQNRKKTGRRDHEVMISGLGSVTILRKWLDILQRLRVPVKGIYSLPLLGQSLLPAIKMEKKRVLLVSQQSTMTLRQSFYDNGHLKLSRLALHRMTRDNSISDVKYVESDVNNTLLYLRSQRLLMRDEPLEVCVVVRDDLYQSFKQGLPGDELVTFTLYKQESLARKMGISTDLPTRYSDGLFAHTLLKKHQISNHYGPRNLTRYYRYHVARKVLLGVAGLILLGGMVFAGSKYYEMQLLEQYASKARVQMVRYRALYQERIGKAKAHQLSPDSVKSGVHTIERLQQYARTTPMSALNGFAELLSRHHNINITRINWVLHPNEDIDINGNTASPRSAFSDDVIDDDVGYQLVALEGEVVDFANNFRKAVEMFESYVGDMQETQRYELISVLKTPFDVDSDTGLSGDSGTAASESLAARSTFNIRLMLKNAE